MRSMVVGEARIGPLRAPPKTIANARQLRRNLSAPEAMLWSRPRARQPGMRA